MNKILQILFSPRMLRAILRNKKELSKQIIDSIGKKAKLGFFDSIYAALFKFCLWAYTRSHGIVWNELKNTMQDPGIARCFKVAIDSVVEYGLKIPVVLTAPLSVVFNLTNRCNLACKHCFQKAHIDETDHMTLQQKLSIIDQLNDAGTAAITFSGGEPLMSDDFFTVAGYAYNKGVFVSIDTNGTLIDETMAKKLHDIGIRYAQISIDSVDPKEHDNFRMQEGAFGKSMQAAKFLSSIGVHLSMGVTLTSFNAGKIDEFIDLAKKNHFNRIVFYHLVPVGRGEEIPELDLTPQQRSAVMEKLAKIDDPEINIISETPHFALETSRIKRKDKSILPNSNAFPITAYFNMRPAYRIFRAMKEIFGGCPAGRLYANIQPNGDLTPCMFSPFYPVVGNLTKQTLKEAWQGFVPYWDRKNLKAACKACKNNIVCGGCRARAASRGDHLGLDYGCDIKKYFVEAR